MTTYHTTSTHVNNSDATFQSWITTLHNAIVGCGLVQTADTGQLDFSTAVKPGVANTSAGYRVYAFNDTLQATAPIFIKLEVGVGTSTTSTFGWRITVGVGTDGAGTVTLPIQLVTGWVSQATASFTGVNDTFACHREGAAWVVFYYENSTLGAMCAFAIFRSVDDNGVVTGEGASVYIHTNNGTGTLCGTLRFAATAAVLSSAGTFLPCLVPFALPDSHVGVDIQVFPHWNATPRIRQNPFAFGYLTSEITHGQSIVVEAFEGMPLTYMPLAGNTFGAPIPGYAATGACALIWD